MLKEVYARMHPARLTRDAPDGAAVGPIALAQDNSELAAELAEEEAELAEETARDSLPS